MIITIDTSIPFSDTDMAVLQALAGVREIAPAKPAPKAAPPAKAEAAPPAKPAPKAAPPAKPAPKAAPPAKAESGSPTLSDAVAAATKLVSSGKTSVVKSALETVGAARVSELSEDKIADFLSALEE